MRLKISDQNKIKVGFRSIHNPFDQSELKLTLEYVVLDSQITKTKVLQVFLGCTDSR